MKTAEKIDEIFHQCCGPNGTVDMRTVFKLLWPTLNNSVSAVDLAGVYAVSIPGSNNSEVLTRDLFSDFFRAFSRLKYPSGNDFCDRLLEDIGHVRGSRLAADNGLLGSMADKNVIRILLKYDLSIRKTFSTFCSQGMRSGGMISWEEVRQLGLGMELEGFVAFCGAFSIVPQLFSAQHCELMFKEVIEKYSLHSNVASLHSSLLYPQFQLMIAFMAVEKIDIQSRKQDKAGGERTFAKKVIDGKSKPLVEILQEFLRDIGISKFDDATSLLNKTSQINADGHLEQSMGAMTLGPETTKKSSLAGTVVNPSSQKPQDMYQSATNHAKQAMMLRMDHLFDEIEAKIISQLPPDAPILGLLGAPPEEIIDSKLRLPTKPVVIGDAVPIPSKCPETVEQLLEAALAHHNLGSYEEALKFLEAARIQLQEIVGSEKAHHNEPIPAEYFDLLMYITLCKGNVYQSCGDDEQSLLQYIDGWSKARQQKDVDWEVICINSAGILAYYNVRYDVALLCFHSVVRYREQAYGTDSSDTATALNNEACALYCLSKRGEARLRFEKAWHTMTAVLGHRAPRAITTWKNLEKARRSHAPLQSKKDLKESIALRDDASHLLIGGSFTIAAIPPPEAGKKKKKGGGGGKKKKKK